MKLWIAGSFMLVFGCSLDAQAPRRDGNWQMTVELSSEVPTRFGRAVGTTMPPFTLTQCITPKMANDRMSFTPHGVGYAVPPKRDCTVDYIVNGNKENWAVKCTGENPLTGTGELTFEGSTYAGSLRLIVPGLVRNADGSHSWRQVPITMKYSGRRVGDCVKK